jgi:hypothetical protein
MIRFVTFYTTKYEDEARQCIQSFADLGIHVDGLFYGTENDWMKNCLKRCDLLRRYWEAHPDEPICLMDSDLRGLKHPKLLYVCNADLALEYRGPLIPEERQYSAGIIFFNNTVFGRKALDIWCNLCIEDRWPNKAFREQYYLKLMVESLKPQGLTVLELPNSYNAKPEQINKDTVILHNVASRRIPHER